MTNEDFIQIMITADIQSPLRRLDLLLTDSTGQ